MTEQTMIERVAREMASSIGADWPNMSEEHYAELLISRPFFRQQARAAIAAMIDEALK